jgi:hypothetical protein
VGDGIRSENWNDWEKPRSPRPEGSAMEGRRFPYPYMRESPVNASAPPRGGSPGLERSCQGLTYMPRCGPRAGISMGRRQLRRPGVRAQCGEKVFLEGYPDTFDRPLLLRVVRRVAITPLHRFREKEGHGNPRERKQAIPRRVASAYPNTIARDRFCEKNASVNAFPHRGPAHSTRRGGDICGHCHEGVGTWLACLRPIDRSARDARRSCRAGTRIEDGDSRIAPPEWLVDTGKVITGTPRGHGARGKDRLKETGLIPGASGRHGSQ